MAHLNTETSKLPHWNIRESSSVRLPLPNIVRASQIDYENLQRLCNIPGLTSRDDLTSDQQAHETFMQNYKHIFVSQLLRVQFPVPSQRMNMRASQGLRSWLPLANKTDNRSARKIHYASEDTGQIQEYHDVLRNERKKEESESTRRANILILRHILRKSPFERTASDNDHIFSILQTFKFFSNKVDPAVLKLMCAVACLELWKDKHFSVYGKTGLHMVLKGSVNPVLKPYILVDGEGMYPKRSVSFGKSDVEDASQVRLVPGDCFGSWFHYEEPYTKELSVLTAEPNCEFMKISAADYQRVITQMKHKEQAEKLNLLMSCDQYQLWPRQPLVSLAACMEWASFPPNTVLMAEGNRSPFVGFIQSGECAILKKLLVPHDSQHGQKEPYTKQVVMGKLGRHNSFAEVSCLQDETVKCSIATTTHVRLGIIKPEKAKCLDEVTRQLMTQSSSRNLGNLTMVVFVAK